MKNSTHILEKKLKSLKRRINKFYILKKTTSLFTLHYVILLSFVLLESVFWFTKEERKNYFYLLLIITLIIIVIYIKLVLKKIIFKPITNNQLAILVGNKFIKIGDKLLNIVQLIKPFNSIFIKQIIEKKTKKILKYDYNESISYKSFKKQLLLLLLLLLTITASFFNKTFKNSFKRIKNYTITYTKEAPFLFNLINNKLEVIEDKNITLKLKLVGNNTPEDVFIETDNTVKILNKKRDTFIHMFFNIKKIKTFRFLTSNYKSKEYFINVLKAPLIQSFEFKISPPKYTKLKEKTISNFGKGIVPEGSVLFWKIKTRNTDTVFINKNNKKQFLKKESKNIYTTKHKLVDTLNYKIYTSNKYLKKHDSIKYSIIPVKDKYPKILIESIKEEVNKINIKGLLSDDYGISSLKMMYKKEKDKNYKYKIIKIDNINNIKFTYKFPPFDIKIEENIPYLLKFVVTDNDRVKGKKSTSSKIINYNNNKIEKESVVFNKSKETLNKLSKLLKEASETEINREKRQLINEIIKKLDSHKDSFEKKLLKKKSERILDKLRENEKLLKELEKLKKENKNIEITKDSLKKETNKNKKSLKQLIELTKRFFIKEQLQKLSNSLTKLSKKQYKQIQRFSKEKQLKINKETSEINNQLQQIRQTNKTLLKPIKIKETKELFDKIKETNSETINKKEKAIKEASFLLKKIADKIKSKSSRGMQLELKTDIQDIRKVLENILNYSFEQEKLTTKVRKQGNNAVDISSNLKRQNVLKEMFVHIEDSLMAIANRQPMISEEINNNVTETLYYIDKTLKELSNKRIERATINQQKTLTTSNELGNVVSEIISNIKNKLSGATTSKNNKKQKQLQNIIKQQGELLENNKNNKTTKQILQEFKKQQQIGDKVKEKIKNKKLEKLLEKSKKNILEKKDNKNTLEEIMYILLETEKSKNNQGKSKQRKSKTNKQTNAINKDITKEEGIIIEELKKPPLPLKNHLQIKTNKYFLDVKEK